MICYRDYGSRSPSEAVGFKSRRVVCAARRGAMMMRPGSGSSQAALLLRGSKSFSVMNRMKLPAMNELLRIVAAAGVTLLVVALAVLFFKWVFS